MHTFYVYFRLHGMIFLELCKLKKRYNARNKRREKAFQSLPISRGRWRAENPDGPVALRLTRVTEGVAPRSLTRLIAFRPQTKIHSTEQHRYIRHRIPKPYIDKRFGGVRRKTDETAKSTAETGVIWWRLPPSRRSEVELYDFSGISACHLPLLRWRLICPYVLFPLHGFSFAQMDIL